MAAEKRNCMFIGICSSYSQHFAADFDIVKSRLPNGIKMIQLCGTIMCENQYGGRETGSSYNFGPVADRNVISSVTTMFSNVVVTMQYRPS